MFLNILGLLFRITEFFFFTILPNKKVLEYTRYSLQTRKKCAKVHLKKPPRISPGSSEQNQDPGCLRTEVRGDFNIDGTKYFRIMFYVKNHDVVSLLYLCVKISEK